jgi:lysophospholipase L1-like esterase
MGEDGTIRGHGEGSAEVKASATADLATGTTSATVTQTEGTKSKPGQLAKLGAVVVSAVEQPHEGKCGSKLQLTGTRGSDFNRHEGRPGWRMYDYINRQSSSGIPNAFYNPTTKKFDFSYYMRVNGYLTPGYVLIEMGINDTFLYYSDSSLNAEIKNILSRYEAMIASIRAYSNTIKIGILVTIPPTSVESTFRADYGTRQTLSRYQRNNTLWVAALKNRFKGRESSNIYLVPTDTGIDRAHIVGVHPDDTAYRQMAAVVWAWMKGH